MSNREKINASLSVVLVLISFLMFSVPMPLNRFGAIFLLILMVTSPFFVIISSILELRKNKSLVVV